MKKKLLYAFIAVIICIFITGCGKKQSVYSVNSTATIDSDKIKITVLGSENATIDSGELSISNGDYTKVKLSIENIGDEVFTWTMIDFQLGNSLLSILPVSESDYLPSTVSPGEKITGYIYFEKSDEVEMVYTSHLSSDGKNYDGMEDYVFKIK